MNIFRGFFRNQARLTRLFKLFRFFAWFELAGFVVFFFADHALGQPITVVLEDGASVVLMAITIFAADFGIACSKRIQQAEAELQRLDDGQ